jgi:hypothetical protein
VCHADIVPVTPSLDITRVMYFAWSGKIDTELGFFTMQKLRVDIESKLSIIQKENREN